MKSLNCGSSSRFRSHFISDTPSGFRPISCQGHGNEKRPRCRYKTITIQHDGATHHKGLTGGLDEAKAWNRVSLRVKLKTQPPHSPTFNALDCGIFIFIRKKVFHSAPHHIDDRPALSWIIEDAVR